MQLEDERSVILPIPTLPVPDLLPASPVSTSRTAPEYSTESSTAQKTEMESEDAAQVLEELALGRRQYPGLLIDDSPTCPTVGRIFRSPPHSFPLDLPHTPSLLEANNLMNGLTSIMAPDGIPPTTGLLQHIPDERVAARLVTEFFVEAGWMYNVGPALTLSPRTNSVEF